MKDIEAQVHKRLLEGRERCEQRDWAQAAALFSAASECIELGAEDLDRLALCLYMQADEDAAILWWEKAHHVYIKEGEPERAIRCAFWSGLTLVFQGKVAQASGWFSRAHRVLQEVGEACVESGYLLLPEVERHLMKGEYEQAFARASEAARVGERFDDPDLIGFARHLQGRVRLRQEQVEEGLALFDEAMISVAAGRLSPPATGLIYCSVIAGCQAVYAFERAKEWTAALASWCDAQPSLVNFTGKCLIHRAEIMRMNGSWADALEEVGRAVERLVSSGSSRASALYQKAEILRLMGHLEEAEQTCALVASLGGDPQPCLGLLRVSQGRQEEGRASIHRALSAAEGARRATLLSAAVEIEAAMNQRSARTLCEALVELSRCYGTTALLADAALAMGRVELAEGDSAAALRSLRTALDLYERLGMPYHVAQVRLGMSEVCKAVGDKDGHAMELEAAEATLKELRAGPSLTVAPAAPGKGPLSRRETEVLHHLAGGETNKEIALTLFLSIRTVDRHVSNIFNKLGVSSRAEATAQAIRRGLI